jgi:hypothetical protein
MRSVASSGQRTVAGMGRGGGDYRTQQRCACRFWWASTYIGAVATTLCMEVNQLLHALAPDDI